MGVIYRATNLYPQNTYISGSVDNIFTGMVNGAKATHYQLKIFTLANVSVYDSTKLALSPNLANGATLSHTVPSSTLTNGNQYKWTLQVWNDADSATTREIVFSAYSNPTVTFNPPATITAQEYNFTATYSQAQSISLNYYRFILYDAFDNIIEDTNNIYDFTISHKFEGFINLNSYGIRLLAEFQINGMVYDSGITSFNISYTEPDVTDINQTAIYNSSTSFVNLSWNKLIQNSGTYVGGTDTYIPNFIRNSNYGLNLINGDYIEYNIDIPSQFTLKFIWKPEDLFLTGDIINLDNGSYNIKYQDNKFIYTINGISKETLPIDLEHTFFYFILLPTKVEIKSLIIYNYWNDHIGVSYSNLLSSYTWEDVLFYD